MSLSDIMGHAGLAIYAEVALIVFMIAFVAVALWTFAPWRKREMDEASRLPLDDGSEGSERPGANP